jgi:phospholipase C
LFVADATAGTLPQVSWIVAPYEYSEHPTPKIVDWPADADGYYDVTVTADTGDSFTRRYAGRIA